MRATFEANLGRLSKAPGVLASSGGEESKSVAAVRSQAAGPRVAVRRPGARVAARAPAGPRVAARARGDAGFGFKIAQLPAWRTERKALLKHMRDV